MPVSNADIDAAVPLNGQPLEMDGLNYVLRQILAQLGTGGGGNGGGPMPGTGGLSTNQGVQTVNNNTLTALAGLTLETDSSYLIYIFSTANAGGLSAFCAFNTDSAGSIVAGSFSTLLGANMQKPADVANLAADWPGTGLAGLSIGFIQITGSNMPIRWVAWRGAAV